MITFVRKFSGAWQTVSVLALLAVCYSLSQTLFNAVFGLTVFRVFSLFLQNVCDLPRTGRLVFVFGGLAVLFAVFRFPDAQLSPYLAIVSANLIIVYAFGHRILNGQDSILYQFVKLGHRGPGMSVEFVLFLKHQCGVWVLFGLVSVGLAGAALAWEPSRFLANKLLLVLLVTQAIWFILSHKIAERRYGRPEKWQTTLRLILNRDVWKNLVF